MGIMFLNLMEIKQELPLNKNVNQFSTVIHTSLIQFRNLTNTQTKKHA